MENLSKGGEYTITPEMKAQLKDFYGNYCSEEETGAELGTASLGFNLSNTYMPVLTFSYVLLRLKPRLAVPSSAPVSSSEQ